MIPEKHVWIFNGDGGRFPGGVFTTHEHAEVWIRARKLSGVLTAYPLDEGCIDWAVRINLLTGRALEKVDDPSFAGSFSSASQEHFHYENGERASMGAL
jgi:hypothetical protein